VATVQNGAALEALIAIVEAEDHPWVVRNAVEALGYLGAPY
jgi:HEAT repeat protein